MNSDTSTKTIKHCKVCSVVIDESRPPNKQVLFSHGEPGTKTRLRSRVCAFAKADGCVNDCTIVEPYECYRPI